MIGYIYKITNLINGKSYIGKTYGDVKVRFREHLSERIRERSKNRPLYRALNKYDLGIFELTTLGKYESGILEDMEILLIKEYDTYENGYNATLGGDGKPYLSFTRKEMKMAICNNKSIKKGADSLGIDPKTFKKFAKTYDLKLKVYSNNPKITSKIAYRIKYDGEPPKDLITEFGISKWTISRIRRGESWKNI